MFSLKADEDIELQLFQLHHSEELFNLVDRNRSHLREWLPWVDNMASPVQYHSIIPIWLKQFADNNGFNAGIRYQGKLAGSIGFHQIDWNNRQTSIGYYLAKDFEGSGIMTRSVQAMINHAFFDLKLNRIEIRCGIKNGKSRAIPERLGFRQEGIIRDGEYLYNRYHDLAVYGLLAREWNY
ncbi:GNAT family N-acetyltransferase [Bacillus sp. CMF12]|uniref:GNAT family N-acetyltransferase n=1 Tax=Bacillaceae TaxID=186817 RepID=UPI001FB1F146|nr:MULTISPECIES: GNAT family protein [Bacillaceae]MDF2039109.1 GNAT family protein [Cytobacillus oceanisediminis]UOE56596.1 GNAT family N-acetyltransferase [Cytobacillus oceanisediminis]USK51086.1 GNAT family N-acetyltransferase [Bacillus sp. CMF12]